MLIEGMSPDNLRAAPTPRCFAGNAASARQLGSALTRAGPRSRDDRGWGWASVRVCAYDHVPGHRPESPRTVWGRGQSSVITCSKALQPFPEPGPGDSLELDRFSYWPCVWFTRIWAWLLNTQLLPSCSAHQKTSPASIQKSQTNMHSSGRRTARQAVT